MAEPSRLEITDVINYPNPFSPNGDGDADRTIIRYTLSRPANVQIKVFNVIGKHVYTFPVFSQGRPDGGARGINEVEWDGRSSSGRIVSNGVFIYKITALADGQKAAARGRIAVLK